MMRFRLYQKRTQDKYEVINEFGEVQEVFRSIRTAKEYIKQNSRLQELKIREIDENSPKSSDNQANKTKGLNTTTTIN